jgi:hypothetical protein
LFYLFILKCTKIPKQGQHHRLTDIYPLLLKTSTKDNLYLKVEKLVILTNYINLQYFKMDSSGDTIWKLRESKQPPSRTGAAFLDIDQAILSPIERGQLKPTREQVLSLAKYFNVKQNDLL